MILKLILEGLGLGCLLYCICAVGICKGAIGMIHLYDEAVQNRVVQLGMITAETIKKRSILFKSFCIPAYILYVFICVYFINGTRGFFPFFIQSFVILFIMNLIDRLLIDDYWVNHTDAWIIPGTQDLRPYIKPQDKKRKWIMGTLGMALIAVLIACLSLLLK